MIGLQYASKAALTEEKHYRLNDAEKVLTEEEQYQLYGKLHAACSTYQNIDIPEIKRLLALGVKPENPRWEKKHNNSSALFALVLSSPHISFDEFTKAFELLCKAGADPKREQGLKGNLLCTAIGFGQTQIVKWLVDVKGFYVNSRTLSKDTALICAIYCRHETAAEILQFLLKRGASPYKRNSMNELPHDIAARRNLKLLDLLPPRPKPAISLEEALAKQVEKPKSLLGNFSHGQRTTVHKYQYLLRIINQLLALVYKL